jgi:hypothetical protein
MPKTRSGNSGELHEIDAAVHRDSDLLALARRVEQVIGRVPGSTWVLSCSA